MVAVIHSSESLRTALNYNENKVKEQQAVCLAAVHYPKDVERLNFYQKLNFLERLAALNIRTKVNSIHISLNFDPSEKLPAEKLLDIARTYMDKIGFGGQPYLVYQHHDAGHPHIHILTTNIRKDGSRIKLHNLGRFQSEKARREIEVLFGLVKADERKEKQYHLQAVDLRKVRYGKTETKRAIANVLKAVLNSYKYASLPELNAVLEQYNIVADMGSEDSRIYKNKGLVYRVLDEQGNKIGVPVKASDIYNKPTLKRLQEKFEQNKESVPAHKARIRNAIDLALLKHPAHSLSSLIQDLKRQNIHVVLRQNAEGLIYGITYVDNQKNDGV